MTTYAYMRVSTVEQADGTSLDDQKRQCKGLAMTHNLTIQVFVNNSAPLTPGSSRDQPGRR